MLEGFFNIVSNLWLVFGFEGRSRWLGGCQWSLFMVGSLQGSCRELNILGFKFLMSLYEGLCLWLLFSTKMKFPVSCLIWESWGETPNYLHYACGLGRGLHRQVLIMVPHCSELYLLLCVLTLSLTASGNKTPISCLDIFPSYLVCTLF